MVLVGVTLFALFVGLTQWRNRRIRGEVDSLANSGCEIYTRISETDALEIPGIGLSEEWIDGIWQRRPNRGNIKATDLGNGSLRLGQDVLSREEFETKILSLQQRLVSLGAKRIFVLIDGQTPYDPPAWLADFKQRSEMIVYFGDTGTSTYGDRGVVLTNPPL
jgi:hypothetical protein